MTCSFALVHGIVTIVTPQDDSLLLLLLLLKENLAYTYIIYTESVLCDYSVNSTVDTVGIGPSGPP